MIFIVLSDMITWIHLYLEFLETNTHMMLRIVENVQVLHFKRARKAVIKEKLILQKLSMYIITFLVLISPKVSIQNVIVLFSPLQFRFD